MQKQNDETTKTKVKVVFSYPKPRKDMQKWNF